MTVTETSPTSKHARYVLTPWSAQGGLDLPSIERAKGVYLYDDAGKRYLDLASGLVAANLGHGNPAVLRAIAEQAARAAYVAPSLFVGARADLAEQLSELSPWPEGCRTFFTTGGGEANEDATKMARAITGRTKILTAYRSFHGSAPGAGTLTGESRRWPNEPATLPGVVRFFAPYPYRSPFNTTDPAIECERALEHLELVLTYENPQSVAALLIEPIVGTNGVVVYPDGYLQGLRKIASRHGIVLIFDEVMTGFGRTGYSFASCRFGVVPDAMTFAKGVTGAYVPLGGVMLRESLAKHFDTRPLGCGHTYSGHPVAMAAASAAIRVYQDERLFERARTIEGWLQEGLSELAERIPEIGDVRGVGAFFSLEFVKDRSTREPIVAWQGPQPGPLPALLGALRRHGVCTFGRFNVMMVAPPLIVTREELDEGFAALERAMKETFHDA
ncbi:MAG: aminotransferase class III-fold pyridoxal phosphate-dependent enzyme [Candidatus Eremiobacteraeota bacterium]|nr:aminotransferase class III-fold pyridoxal phosphate-dependent enzyme [Candidatus Eremiobacteraeota bacterium]